KRRSRLPRLPLRIERLEERNCPTYSVVDLGSLGGASAAEAVNVGGQVVGQAYLAGNETYHAFSWQSATGMVDLGTLGGLNSDAKALNATGQIAGWAESLDAAGHGIAHAALWQNGVATDLGTLGAGTSAAYALNNSG